MVFVLKLKIKKFTFISISFLYSGSMDIFILYGRIQMLVPSLKFLSKISVYKVAVLLAFFSCVINLPINLSRQAFKAELKIDSNVTTILYSYGKISNIFILFI